jgi:hypothetical protein
MFGSNFVSTPTSYAPKGSLEITIRMRENERRRVLMAYGVKPNAVKIPQSNTSIKVINWVWGAFSSLLPKAK